MCFQFMLSIAFRILILSIVSTAVSQSLAQYLEHTEHLVNTWDVNEDFIIWLASFPIKCASPPHPIPRALKTQAPWNEVSIGHLPCLGSNS